MVEEPRLAPDLDARAGLHASQLCMVTLKKPNFSKIVILIFPSREV
jgi:hypothetical protein